MSLYSTLTSAFEILAIGVMINYLLSFFWNTRSMDLMIGALSFLVIFLLTSWMNLPILHTIMTHVANVAAVAFLVIFQPELRFALSKLSVKGKRFKELTEFDKFLDQLANSIYRLADKRVGALIALEHEDKLDEYAHKGVMLDASFSSELLESIFATSTPLHDGAMIIRDMTIVAAAAILPLAEDSAQTTSSMGTRHRAALGASQMTDAVLIVVSEESGKVSIARDGIITRGVKADRFKGIIRSVFSPPEKPEKLKLKEWFAQ